LESNLRSPSLLLNGSTTTNFVGDFIFIRLPNGLRPKQTDQVVPTWNVWDEVLPNTLFRLCVQTLSNSGSVCIVQSGEYAHTKIIRESAEKQNNFKHVQSYTVILSEPLWRAESDVQVCFCN